MIGFDRIFLILIGFSFIGFLETVFLLGRIRKLILGYIVDITYSGYDIVYIIIDIYVIYFKYTYKFKNIRANLQKNAILNNISECDTNKK